MVNAVINTLESKLRKTITEQGLGNAAVRVSIGTLTTRQAIGNPVRQDYPLLEGKEVMIEAEVNGGYGQAFTDRPRDFTGSLDDVLSLDLNIIENRAVFIATLNGVMSSLKTVSGVRHCHDEEPEECAREMAAYLRDNYSQTNIGLIGLQPAILDQLVRTFGSEHIRCTDMNPANIGTLKYGAEIWDGRTDTARLIAWSDTILATSSTIVNNSYDDIKENAEKLGKRLIIFGVTGAGASALLGIEHFCFQPH